jgi:hypothetical protein
MNKRLANPAIFQPTTSSPIRSWYSAWRGWNEARKLRMRKRAETVSGLNAWTLYDIGESDYQGGQAVVAGHVGTGGRGPANTGASIKNGQ